MIVGQKYENLADTDPISQSGNLIRYNSTITRSLEDPAKGKLAKTWANRSMDHNKTLSGKKFNTNGQLPHQGRRHNNRRRRAEYGSLDRISELITTSSPLIQHKARKDVQTKSFILPKRNGVTPRSESKIERVVTIVSPSKHGYHARSYSPTFRSLCDVRERLDELLRNSPTISPLSPAQSEPTRCSRCTNHHSIKPEHYLTSAFNEQMYEKMKIGKAKRPQSPPHRLPGTPTKKTIVVTLPPLGKIADYTDNDKDSVTSSEFYQQFVLDINKSNQI